MSTALLWLGCAALAFGSWVIGARIARACALEEAAAAARELALGSEVLPLSRAWMEDSTRVQRREQLARRVAALDVALEIEKLPGGRLSRSTP